VIEKVRFDLGGMQSLMPFASRALRNSSLVAFVDHQSFGVWRRRITDLRSGMVAHLPFGEQQGDRPAILIRDGAELGVQPAVCPPNATWRTPYLTRLAAVRWALR
jgi:hypothetical protein